MEVRASVVQAIPSEASPPPQALAIAATASRHKMWTDLLGARAPLVRCSGFATLRLSLLKGSRWTSISTTEMSVSHLCSATNPNGQKTRPSQFPDESHPVDGHRVNSQRGQQQRPVSTISTLPSAPWSTHCTGRRLGFFDHTGCGAESFSTEAFYQEVGYLCELETWASRHV